MTVRTTTLRGPDAGVYYVEGLPSYYLDSGEPPGRWEGAGAEMLGLAGEVDPKAFLAVMAGEEPDSGSELGRSYGERSVRGFDVTASAPKAVSVLFALGHDAVRNEVLEAHDTAVAVMVDWIERHAHTRFRIDGEIAVVDTEGVIAATFRQHTSRALDPQLHTHVVIANRVRSPDGRWLALDARTIKLDQRTLSAVYHASVRTELRRRLGVRWHQPVNGIAEIAGVPEDILVAFSARTDAIRRRIDEKLDRFTDHFDRDPTPRERWRLEREAVIESRPSKAHCVDGHSLHHVWMETVRSLGYDPEVVTAHATTPGLARLAIEVEGTLGEEQRKEIVRQALHALRERQSTWRPAELVRELAAAVPTETSVPADNLVPWLDQLSEEVINEALVDLSRPVPDGARLRRDGRPFSESVANRALTTPDILAEEERLVAWAEQRMNAGGAESSAVLAEAPGSLTVPQREAAAAMAGTELLALLVGPAGSGKTSAARRGVDQLRGEGRAVFGVAPSATAAEVLASESGIAADTLDKLLIEHRLERPPDHRYDLPPGATVLVDEAAMVPTPRLAELADLADRRGWRVVLIGDPLQFSAVGRSGMFGYLVETSGAIELDRVHRFTHDWERDASLRLRRGDSDVVEVYERHGRLHGGTRSRMQAATVAAWWDATDQGETAAMMAPTTEAVIGLNHAAQSRRIQAGMVDPAGPHREAGPYRLHVGDYVATRRNSRQLCTDRGLMVKNRDHWIVEAVHRGGDLSVSGKSGSVRLPADYVAEHVELAYAETSHASQGRTVDRSFVLLDGRTDVRGIYVPMTRGRHSNEVFAVLDGEQSAADVMADALARDWIDQPALARRAELQRPTGQPSGTALVQRPLEPSALRLLLERGHSLAHHERRADVEVGVLTRQLNANQDQRQRLARSLAADRDRLELAEQTLEQLDRPMRRRRHRAEIDAAIGQIRRLPAAIERDRVALAGLDAKEVVDRQRLVVVKDAVGNRGDVLAERLSLTFQLDLDVTARADHLRDDPPDYLTDRLGQRPFGVAGADLWDRAAGAIDQHRTAFGIEGPSLLGRQPRWDDGAYATSHKAARSAAERLDRALGRTMEMEPPGRELGLNL